MILILILVLFYHVPTLGPDVNNDSVHQEREKYNYQLGLEAYQKLDERYGDGGF